MMLHVGQFNLPSRDRYEAAMRGIFERRYYTNQGPLVRGFEERLQAFLNVKHAVCVTNATIGLMMASEALGINGRAVVPAVCNMALAHALWWCRVQPVFADVGAHDGQLDVDLLTSNIADMGPINAIIAANLWGNASDARALTALASEHELPLMFDSSHAFGCVLEGRRIGSFGGAEVFSFDAADMINAGGGACVATDDDELAARLRNIRSSYGAGRPVPVVKTSNGRMSEAQAALGLLSLDDYEVNRARNQVLTEGYRNGLRATCGIRVIEANRVDASNHQAFVCAVDEDQTGLSRDALIEHLAEHGIEAVAVRALGTGERVGSQIDRSWVRLPLGAHVGVADVERVCALIDEAVARRGCARSLA